MYEPITPDRLDSLIRKVTRPARYTGAEWNAVVKPWDTAAVRLALVYPDLYEVGMCNLGLSLLYHLVNGHPHFLAERAYTPWTDMEGVLRQTDLPLYSLESKHPLKDFDVVGFSLGYELTYTNVLNTLDLAHIPPRAAERDDLHPLVIAGGSCALNPEPMVDFIDLFLLGDGEEVLLELLALVRDWKGSRAGMGIPEKQRFLRHAAQLPGIYIPSMYHVAYHADGTIAGIEPTTPEATLPVLRRVVSRLPPIDTKPVVPYLQVIHDRAVIELQRGCTQGCRFCQAGIIYRPVRRRSMDEVLEATQELLANTGYDELALLSLSATDHPQIEPLVAALVERYGDSLNISLPSLRIDNFSIHLAELISHRKRPGLTFAPEAGTQRLRDVINKNVSEADLLQTVETAFARGWTGLKLYFMVGLPTETLDDVRGIADLVGKVRQVGSKLAGHRFHLNVSVATFVPKAHTPFQWDAQNTAQELEPKQALLRAGLRRSGVQFSWQDPQVSLLEAALARGDRRLGAVIERAWRQGCTFDAWSERFDFGRWGTALAACDLNPAFYAHRQRPEGEILPWAHIRLGITPAFLWRERQLALQGQVSPNCQDAGCLSCGLEETCPVTRQNAT